MDAQSYTLTDQEWIQASFNVSSATVVVNGEGRVRAHVGFEYAPPIDTTNYTLIAGLYFVQKIPPFQSVWLRADRDEPVDVIVYKGERMSGVVYFGRSPFRIQGPSVVQIEVPYVPQILDGGSPDTDYTGLAVIDCGGVTPDPAVRTIDGRIAGEAP